jgi:isoleucyl-tRNA synthetase
MPFKPVSSQVDFVALENEVLEWWAKEGILEKYLHKNDGSETTFSFLDGPITANNPMGVHHAWGRTYKDLFQRFHNLLGDKQRFQNGFDEQGLWVEVEVEKELGIKNKKEIKELVAGDEFASLEKFINLCKERVVKYSAIQTEQSKRLGYFMDWQHSYHTSSTENNYAIWHFLQVCQQKGWIYKGHDAVPWCPRCGTAISQMEILTEEYKELTHDSIYFKLPIKGREGQSLLVWTTTPWTIPANVAVAVNGAEIYVQYPIDDGKESVWVMKQATERLVQQGILPENTASVVINSIQGSLMVGWEYTAPFDDLPMVVDTFGSYVHRVIDGKEVVTSDEGTGLLHVAPGAGAEDFKLGKDNQLPVIAPIEEDASYVAGMGDYAGLSAKKHPELIIDALKAKDDGHFLMAVKPYKHRYPTCWRCKTELVWRVVDEWYISVDTPDNSGKTYRQQMIETAKAIHWMPEWGLAREMDWLQNLGDWLISKKRFWGLALPIYEDTDGSFIVVGSVDELKELAAEGWPEFEGHSPHRPWVDRVKIKSPKTGSTLTRIPDVGNPWLDAGIVPFSTLPAEWFPADFIVESFPGQFKNWFYAMIAMSTVLKDERPTSDGEVFKPYRTVLGFATVRDEHGREMHKSSGNSIEFNAAAEQVGAEAMRWQYVTANPENNLNFGFGPAKEIQRRFFLIWWNVYNFFITYANLDGWVADETSSSNTLDVWILSRLTHLIEVSNESLTKFDAMTASRALESFIITDVSTWYIRRSRDRVGPAALNQEDKQAFYQTCYRVLMTTLSLGSSYLPFLTDAMYQNLSAGQSVHLSNWPIQSSRNEGLEQSMTIARQLVELGHAAREDHKIKLKQPLASATYWGYAELSAEVTSLLRAELNVLKVEWGGGHGDLRVEFDTNQTPLLREMGEARELVRSIQAERKKLGCELDARVVVTLPAWPESQAEEIKRQTLADELKVGDELKVEVVGKQR